ncbi:MAG: hypothetical protein ACRC1F_00530 [Metamycoplasmataceae bacterium]
MSSNINPKSCKAWLKSNGWILKNKTKHELWIYEDAQLDAEDSLTINFHREKGDGIAEGALKDIARIMKIKKSELIVLIRQDKKMKK